MVQLKSNSLQQLLTMLALTGALQCKIKIFPIIGINNIQHDTASKKYQENHVINGCIISYYASIRFLETKQKNHKIPLPSLFWSASRPATRKYFFPRVCGRDNFLKKKQSHFPETGAASPQPFFSHFSPPPPPWLPTCWPPWQPSSPSHSPPKPARKPPKTISSLHPALRLGHLSSLTFIASKKCKRIASPSWGWHPPHHQESLFEWLVINWEWGCYFCIWVVWELVKQAIRYSIKYSIDPPLAPNIVKFIFPRTKTLPRQFRPCPS